MSQPSPFSQEQLSAYLDGEADPETKTQIDRVRARDGVLAKRLDALALDKPALRRAFDGLLSEAPPMPAAIRPPARAHQGWMAPLRMAGSAAALFVAGFFANEALRPASVSDWQDYATAYHRLYDEATVAAISHGEAEQIAQLVRASAAIETPLDLEAVRGTDLRFLRAQILAFEEQPLIQLAFADPNGRPVALCIFPAGGEPSAPEASHKFGVSQVAWSTGQNAFLLLGEASPETVARFRAALG
ncbi:MAG: hypothetical protein AAGC57_16860 [Pseudomonadota bacterium]